MKQFVAIIIMVITVSTIAPTKSQAADPTDPTVPNKIVWDSSTLSENLPQIIASDQTLIIMPDTIIDLPIVQTITINGLVKFESGLSLIKLNNLNFIIDSQNTNKSLITNLDLRGSIIVKNGNFALTKSHLQNPTGTALDIQNSTDFQINKNVIANSDIGITILPPSVGTIENNHFENNRLGLEIDNNQSLKISSNNFDSNLEYAVQAQNFKEGITLDLSQNWWGCALGPNNLDQTCQKTTGPLNFPKINTLPISQIEPGDIIISEIFPDPPIEYDQEWFEIYNSLPYPIASQKVKIYSKDSLLNLPVSEFIPYQYTIIASIIEEFKKLVIKEPDYKIISLGRRIGSGLSNDGGHISIYDVNNSPINSLSYGNLIDPIDTNNTCLGKSTEKFSCARFDDKYEWTSIPTPGAINQKSPIIVVPPVIIPPVIPPTTNYELPATNNCPATIKINQANSYYNCRVTITGKVKRSYGSYFYIYDETGELKVYLQFAKKIKKPRLTANLLIKVTGTLDNYKTGLRLLPDTSSDIELINPPTITVASAKPQQTAVISKPESIQPQPEITSQPSSPLLQTPNSLLPAANAVKGASNVAIIPLSSHLPLKIALFCAIIVLVALFSFNLGAKYGNVKS